MGSVLIIDDDNFVREMMLQMVAIEGHNVTGAENGQIAIRLFEKNKFDLVISDIVMPEKEGLETIMHIRKIRPALPIIAVSGGARIEPTSYLDIAKQLGVRYTFIKPFNRLDMIQAINNCLSS
jgi:CheY-like chemotaxis protein